MGRTFFVTLFLTLLLFSVVGCSLEENYSTEQDRLLPFHEEGKFGFINKEGKVLIEPMYEAFWGIEYGIRIIEDRKSPLMQFPAKAPVVANFNIVRNNEKWGAIDNMEEVVIDFKYDEVNLYNGEIVIFKKEERYYAYNILGEVVFEGIGIDMLEDRTKNIIQSQISSLIIEQKDGKLGYIDKDGNVVIDHQFDLAFDFNDGLALVTEEFNKTGFGYIKKDGEYSIEPKFVKARSFNEGIAAVKERRDSRFYYIDTNGDKIEGIKCDIGFSCIDGVIRLVDFVAEKTRYVTKNGELIFEYDHFDQNIF